jgi:hypothetical protein
MRKSEDGTNSLLMEDCYQYPDKLRRTVTRISDGKEMLLSVVNGKNMWARVPNKKVTLFPIKEPYVALPPIIDRVYWLMNLKNRQSDLSLDNLDNNENHQAESIIISSDGHPISKIYFDLKTHYVIKDIKYGLPDFGKLSESLNKIVLTVANFSEHKNFDGVILPTRLVVTQDNENLFDVTLQKVEFPNNFDEHLFDKPEERN